MSYTPLAAAGNSKTSPRRRVKVDPGLNAVELLNTEFPEPKWAVDGIFSEGANLLVGRPKSGKSWLALNIAIAVSHGGIALGSIPVEAGPVLCLSLEDPRRRSKKRLQQALCGDAPSPNLDFRWTWPRIGMDGGDRAIDEWLEDHPGARLVVVDVLAKIRPPKAAGKSIYEGDYDDVAALKSVADKHGVCIIIVHHSRKMEADDIFDTVSGSLGITAAADTITILKRKRSSQRGILAVTGRDVEERGYDLELNNERGQWTMIGQVVEEEGDKPTEARQDVLEWLALNGKAVTPSEFAAATGKGEPAAKMMLYRMEKDGLIAKHDGHYGLKEWNAQGVDVTGYPCNPVTVSLAG
ncbi:MAG: AAA family ATPase [Pirellulales bacterium]